MTVTALGEVSIGAALPAVSVALAPQLGMIEAQLAALAQFVPTPPDLNVALSIAEETVENLLFSIAVGLDTPELQAQLQVAALAQAYAELQVLLDLQAQLLASIHLYRYDGATGSFGTEMQAELSGGLPGGSGSDVAFALTLIATAGPSVDALKRAFHVD